MKTQAGARLAPLLLVGVLAIVAAFAGSASISDQSAQATAATAAPQAAAMAAPDIASPGEGAVRRKGRCAGCGVVESIDRIERQPISDGARETGITSSYRIVVRLRDGSRHVFNETTARALQSGERVQVIVGEPAMPRPRGML